MSLAASLAIALILDALLGEPRWLWSRIPHPAVLMGRAIARADETINRGTRRRLRGAFVVLVLVGVAGAIGLLPRALPGGVVLEILIAASLLAQRSLADHVSAVARALEVGLLEARARVAEIVGRDTAALDEPGIARAAIESAAENLSDAVIAPAFWYLFAGLPGLVIYKAVNTADSMIGYRTPRHEAFGWAAARLDDMLNWFPARLTAFLIAALYNQRRAWSAIAADARRHRSPNAGWPEAALARALNIALSGPRQYHGRLTEDPFVHPSGKRDIGAPEIDASVALLWRVWGAVLTALCLAALLPAL